MQSRQPLQLPAFRLGDIRGRYPEEIDEPFVTAFARAFVARFELEGVIVTGRDMRPSSVSLQQALNVALSECGLDVRDLGLCPTELGYFASTRSGVSACIIVTASHNPPAYNGLKCVLAGGRAVTFDTGLDDVMALMLEGSPSHIRQAKGRIQVLDLVGEYIQFLANHFPVESLNAGRIALNGLNGTAATLAVNIADSFDLPVTWFRREPGPIPEEGADPGKPRLTREMKAFMSAEDFSLGVAWDGDCDRCVLFDSSGDMIPTYYVIGLLAAHFLKRQPGAPIVFDTKLCWNTIDVIQAAGGKPVPSETGHAFVKRRMKESRAIYGGELSSHHFFGDFFHCDSGMFAWLTATQLASNGVSIGDLIAERRQEVCCTPEINLSLADVGAALEALDKAFRPDAVAVRQFDGISFEMKGGWRFSVCPSKTEPLVRTNFESRGHPERLLEHTREVLDTLSGFEPSPVSHEADIRIV